MPVYGIRRYGLGLNEFDTAMSQVAKLVNALSPMEAAMHAAAMVGSTEIERRVAPFLRMMAAAPTAGLWEYDGIRYTIVLIEE